MVRSVLTIRAARRKPIAREKLEMQHNLGAGRYEQQRQVREEAVGCSAKVVGNLAIPDQRTEKAVPCRRPVPVSAHA